MPIQKIKSGRIITVDAPTYVGDKGVIFYDESTPELRLSDGVTPGGILFTNGGTSTFTIAPATTSTLGGIKAGAGLSISPDGTLTALYSTTSSFSNNSDVNLVNIQDNQTLIYNSSTSKFENIDIKLTGGTVNQILVKKTGSDYDYQWEDLNITLQTTATVYTKLIDDTSTISTMYLGEALPEQLEADPAWRIQKIAFDANGNVDSVRFAGTGTFTQIWNNRTILTYL